LLWRAPLGRNWTVEADFAYVFHNGAIDGRLGDGSSDQHLLYGSRDLFLTTVGVERSINDRIGVQLFVAHYSHGQVLGHGRNQGSEEIGVRMVWRPSSGARRDLRDRQHGATGVAQP
jgi:lipid A 3-O-deacylase